MAVRDLLRLGCLAGLKTVAVIVCFEEGRNDHVKMVSPGIVMFESVNIASVNSSFVQPRCQNHQNIENVLFFLNFYWPLL